METAIESGSMPLSDAAIRARAASPPKDDLLCHLQLALSREGESEAYWVERIRDSWQSGHMVYLSFTPEGLMAACECKWFLDYFKGTTTCQHIYASYLTSRKRR
jgi:hypothetical protein